MCAYFLFIYLAMNYSQYSRSESIRNMKPPQNTPVTTYYTEVH